MTITLYNTATRRKDPFVPIDPENVRMYVCGPTVYDRAHLGNARPVLVFDVLYRLLRHTYGADHVTYVRNFTDVDDRINETALTRQRAGADGTLEALIRERSDETIRWYHDDMDALGALRPSAEPRATEYIAQMVDMIAQLEADGFAYVRDGHVLFRVRKYEAYGALSGRSVDDMIAGARVEVAPYKEDPMDFVLWKPSSDDLPGWESPWGRGRPGWHIECSAMAHDLLGSSFDIHGGGNDLTFPHHENEIAQSRCAGHGFANVWMHNEMLQVEGKKMSKSLGNFFTVRDLLEGRGPGGQGVPGEVIRFVMLSTHYRKPMDWTEKKRAEAEKWLRDVAHVFTSYSYLLDQVADPKFVDAEVLAAISEDLNTSLAITRLRGLLKQIAARDFASSEQHELHEKTAKVLIASSELLLGLNLRSFAKNYLDSDAFMSPAERRATGEIYDRVLSEEPINLLEIKLADLRQHALETKDFSTVDELKSRLAAVGVEVRISKDKATLIPGPDTSVDDLKELL